MNIVLNLEIYQLICIGLNNILWRNILRMAPETETQSNSAQRYWHKKVHYLWGLCTQQKPSEEYFQDIKKLLMENFQQKYLVISKSYSLNKRQFDPLAIFYTFKTFDIYMLFFKRIWIVSLERFVWIKSNDRIQEIIVLKNRLIKRLREPDLWN